MKEYIIKVDDSKPDAMGSVPLMDKPKELVRCVDCKHGCLMASGKVYMCESPEQNKKICVHVHKPDWFCADGEREQKDG